MLIKTNSNGFNYPIASDITERSVVEGRRDTLKWLASGAAGSSLALWASCPLWVPKHRLCLGR